MGSWYKSAIRGFLSSDFTKISFSSIKDLVVIPFQWNPQPVKNTYTVKYGDFQPAGTELPIKYYVSGGDRRIKFMLHFDATELAKQYGLHIPLNITIGGINMVGVLPVIAALETFMKSPETRYTLAQFKRGGMGNIEPPPNCIFCMGSDIHMTKMVSLSINKTLFNRLLIPMRIEANIELSIIQDEYFYGYNSVLRKFFKKNILQLF